MPAIFADVLLEILGRREQFGVEFSGILSLLFVISVAIAGRI